MVMIIAREMYVLKRYGTAWRGEISETLMLLGYKSSEEDADVWMNWDFKPKGDPYYNYILLYVDNFIR